MMLKTVAKDYTDEHDNDLKFFIVETTKSHELVKELGIQRLPHLLLVTQGLRIPFEMQPEKEQFVEWLATQTTPEVNELEDVDMINKLKEKKRAVASAVLFTSSDESEDYKTFFQASKLDYTNVEFYFVTKEETKEALGTFSRFILSILYYKLLT